LFYSYGEPLPIFWTFCLIRIVSFTLGLVFIATVQLFDAFGFGFGLIVRFILNGRVVLQVAGFQRIL